MRLVVATPGQVLVDEPDVAALHAEDASGSFGVLPGHADLLTVLVPSVLAWRDRAGAEHYVALRGGVLSVRAGAVEVATRQAFAGDDLDDIAARLHAEIEVAREREAAARTEHVGMEAQVVRLVERYLEAGRVGPLGEA